MMLFSLAEVLADECDLLVVLVAFHRELGASTVLPALDSRGLAQALRYDSCGVWVIGGVKVVKVLSMATEFEMAAMHPAMLEVAQGRFKRYTRGYELKSYVAPERETEAYRRARGVPDEDLVKRLLAIWAMHDVRADAPSRFAWDLNRQVQAGEFWHEVAECLPLRGEKLEALSGVQDEKGKSD
jgi:hypothetical protein